MYRYGEGILFLGFLLAAWLLCGQISYTDGDDAYFSAMAHSMPFWDYLKMRYVDWEGRMTSEAMTYLAFYLGKGFWQLANSVILALLPAGLVHMMKKLVGEQPPARSFLTTLLIYLVILSVGLPVIGYGAFWITGSTFYLWPIVAGIWALMPYADLVYREQVQPLSFLYAIPCGFVAAMGQEQIAAVAIAFALLAVGTEFYRRRRLPLLHLLEVGIMIAALVLLFISPGTDARTQIGIELCMPQFATMSVGNHIFITVQWVLESFAKDGKMLFGLIWVFAAMLLLPQREQKKRICGGICVVAAVVALLPFLDISLFSEMGTGVTDISQCVTQVATPSSLSAQNWLALVWWLAAVLFTLVLLWLLGETLLERMQLTLLLLAACASEALMYFSPTMYASGARVYFMAHVLLWLLVSLLGEKLIRRGRIQAPVIAGAAGVLHVVCGISVIAAYL